MIPAKDSRIIFVFGNLRTKRSKLSLESGYVAKVLLSYYYLREIRSGLKSDLVRLRQHVHTILIDSGVFTLKTHEIGSQLNSKPWNLPEEFMTKMLARAKKKLPEFNQFTRDYGAWLHEYDKYYDWAIEMDVDQFLGVPTADKYFEFLRKKMPHPRKLLRVWHHTRTFDEWVAWCKSGEFDYLAVEGGGSHSSDPEFYRRFADIAHENNVKVHVLAITQPQFFRQVPVDTGDSKSWMSGGMYGHAYTPYGIVEFGRKSGKGNWKSLGHEIKKKVIRWWRSVGLDPEQVINSYAYRDMSNIVFFRTEHDRKFDVKKMGYVQHGFLEHHKR